MINCEKIVHLYPLGTFSAFHYMLCIFLTGYNSRTIQDIEFSFSGFLLFVESTNSVQFQRARYSGFKVDSFRISLINQSNAAI